MFEERLDQMTADEAARFDKLCRASWLERMFGRKRIREQSDFTSKQVQVIEVSVDKCFVPKKFDEENPLLSSESEKIRHSSSSVSGSMTQTL
jgi:hypothetical protein